MSDSRMLALALPVAFAQCVTLDDFEAVVEQIRDQAKAGDLKAAEIFLQYTHGRPRPAPREVKPVPMGDLTTIAGCGESLDNVLAALSRGGITQDDADAYATLIARRLDVHRAALGADEGADDSRDIIINVERTAIGSPGTN